MTPMPTLVILEAASRWKRRRISIPYDSEVEIIPSQSWLVSQSPSPTPISPSGAPISPSYLFLGSSSQHSPSFKMEDIFSNLRLDHAPICFLILNEEENGMMETILQGRSTLGPDGLDMMEVVARHPLCVCLTIFISLFVFWRRHLVFN